MSTLSRGCTSALTIKERSSLSVNCFGSSGGLLSVRLSERHTAGMVSASFSSARDVALSGTGCHRASQNVSFLTIEGSSDWLLMIFRAIFRTCRVQRTELPKIIPLPGILPFSESRQSSNKALGLSRSAVTGKALRLSPPFRSGIVPTSGEDGTGFSPLQGSQT